MKGRTLQQLFWGGCLLLSIALSGCGGGGGGSSSTVSGTDTSDTSNTDSPTTPVVTTVSGVAAAGAPLSGSVSLKDINGKPDPALTTTLAADGSFSFDITGLTPPFFLKASGVAGNAGYELHSLVPAPGTGNVTPLTDAIVQMTTGKAPAEAYADPASTGDAESLKVAFEQAASDLMEILAPLLEAWEAPTNLNPVTDVFVADGTGLDAFLDGTDINVSTTNIAVSDKATGSTLVEIPAEGEPVVNTAQIETVATVADDFSQIKTFLGQWLTAVKTLSTQFANGEITAEQVLQQASAYYDDSADFGVNNGVPLETEINYWLEDYVYVNAIQSISGVGVVEKRADGAYLLAITVTLKLGDNAALTEPWVMPVAVINRGVPAGAADWRVTGNGLYTDIQLEFETIKNLYTDGSGTTVVGLDLDLEDEAGVFASALITGDGLPAEGLTLASDEFHWDMTLPWEQESCANTACTERNWNHYELTDSVIGQMPELATYTITMVSAVPEVADEVYTVTKLKPLTKAKVLAGDYLPELVSPQANTLAWAEANLIAKTGNMTYSTPESFLPVAAGVEYWFDYTGPGVDYFIEAWYDNIPLGQNMTKEVTVQGIPDGTTLTWGEVNLWALDSQGREYSTRANYR